MSAATTAAGESETEEVPNDATLLQLSLLIIAEHSKRLRRLETLADRPGTVTGGVE